MPGCFLLVLFVTLVKHPCDALHWRDLASRQESLEKVGKRIFWNSCPPTCVQVSPSVVSLWKAPGSSSSPANLEAKQNFTRSSPHRKGEKERKCHHPIDFSIVRWSGMMGPEVRISMRWWGWECPLSQSSHPESWDGQTRKTPPSPITRMRIAEDEGNYYSPKQPSDSRERPEGDLKMSSDSLLSWKALPVSSKNPSVPSFLWHIFVLSLVHLGFLEHTLDMSKGCKTMLWMHQSYFHNGA